MKHKLYIIALLSLMSFAAYAATSTQAQEWKSTAPMKMSGSAYSPQVTEVGAACAASAAASTEASSPNKAPGGPRKDKILGPDSDYGHESPIGDAVLPLLLMAAAFAAVVAVRRKRTAKTNRAETLQ